MKALCALALVWACSVSSAMAQSVTGEVSVTGGVSTDRVAGGATQARVFGDAPWFRYYVEGAWTKLAAGAGGEESEAFATAYPYEGPPRVMEAYLEKLVDRGRFVGGIRAGRFRTPFGIHDAGDHAYVGFLRAPLVRYEGYWALSNTFLEHGVNLVAGTSFLQAEVTAARPADVSDDVRRRAGTDTVVRVQGYRGPLVVGVSHVRSPTYGPVAYTTGQMVFTGVDARWMSAGVQLRGEWLVGRPWNGSSTEGGYLDALIHRPFMGPLSVVARVEALEYREPLNIYSSSVRGAAIGGRVKLMDGLHGQVNVTHRPSEPHGPSVTATDVALTYTVRYPR